jgi:hypothetical protein
LYLSSSKHWSEKREQQRKWIGERDQVDIVMATGGVCLGVGTPFYCACPFIGGLVSVGVRENPSDMNATQHTGVSSGLHDILGFIWIKWRFVKMSTPDRLHCKITNAGEKPVPYS